MSGRWKKAARILYEGRTQVRRMSSTCRAGRSERSLHARACGGNQGGTAGIRRPSSLRRTWRVDEVFLLLADSPSGALRALARGGTHDTEVSLGSEARRCAIVAGRWKARPGGPRYVSDAFAVRRPSRRRQPPHVEWRPKPHPYTGSPIGTSGRASFPLSSRRHDGDLLYPLRRCSPFGRDPDTRRHCGRARSQPGGDSPACGRTTTHNTATALLPDRRGGATPPNPSRENPCILVPCRDMQDRVRTQ
jgi:hypothetical protein